MTTHLSPSEIAARLQRERPHLAIEWDSLGGGIMGIVAHDLTTTDDVAVYLGLSNGCLGWSDSTGDVWGEDAGVLNADADWGAWQLDEPLPSDTDPAVAYALGVLDAQLPPARPAVDVLVHVSLRLDAGDAAEAEAQAWEWVKARGLGDVVVFVEAP